MLHSAMMIFSLTQCPVSQIPAQIKPMDLFVRQSANRSDTRWYREDLQRCMTDKDTVLCAGICETGH
jgi:hypothetical protein